MLENGALFGQNIQYMGIYFFIRKVLILNSFEIWVKFETFG